MFRFVAGAFTGAGAVSLFVSLRGWAPGSLAARIEEDRRQLLPKRIILIRHGQSEANIDPTIYCCKADNLIELTDQGSRETTEAGERIKAIIGDESVFVYSSPFQRTYQSCRNISKSLLINHQHHEVDPNIREQEMGNLQDASFAEQRKAQLEVGRFWYRFNGGESGADVYCRVNLFWNNLQHLNIGTERFDNVLIVSHGLTMRLLLMRLFHWSPDTFETVWNPENCEIWVLKKDLSKSGPFPYVLDGAHGSLPRSSREVKVKLKNGEEKLLLLENYLSLPAPRTRAIPQAIEVLSKAHGLNPNDVVDIDFFSHKKFSKFM